MNWLKSKKVYIPAIILVSFLIGLGFGSPVETTETKEIIPQETQERLENYDKLKKVDDELINIASKGFGIASEMVLAASTLNAEKLDQLNKDMDDLNEELTKKTDERLELLNKLGY